MSGWLSESPRRRSLSFFRGTEKPKNANFVAVRKSFLLCVQWLTSNFELGRVAVRICAFVSSLVGFAARILLMPWPGGHSWPRLLAPSAQGGEERQGGADEAIAD